MKEEGGGGIANRLAIYIAVRACVQCDAVGYAAMVDFWFRVVFIGSLN